MSPCLSQVAFVHWKRPATSTLPAIEEHVTTVSVDSFTGDNAVYQADPQAWTCTCQEWRELRAVFPERDVRRLCPHLVHVLQGSPMLLPPGFKERDRRILERLEPRRLGYPLCRRVISLPLPSEDGRSGPDTGDIFLPLDRNTPWVSVLSGEGLFHYHPLEDRWANRRLPASPRIRQDLELRIHKTLAQERARDASQAGDPSSSGAPQHPAHYASPHGDPHGDPHADPHGDPHAEQDDAAEESLSTTNSPRSSTATPFAAPPSPPSSHPSLGFASGSSASRFAASQAASPHAAPPHAAPPHAAMSGREQAVEGHRLHFGVAGEARRGQPGTPRGASGSRLAGAMLVLLLALAVTGGLYLFSASGKGGLSVSALRDAVLSLLDSHPPPPMPGRDPGANASPPPPQPPSQPVVDQWPPQQQARDILKLIEDNPRQGRYTITKKLQDRVVFFGADLDLQTIFRIQRHATGTEEKESWQGETLRRLEHVAKGGQFEEVGQ